jgi:hypothetical protein
LPKEAQSNIHNLSLKPRDEATTKKMTMASRFRMAPRTLALALLWVSGRALGASSASTERQHRRAADFDWDIAPQKDSPTVAFNNASLDNEVIFAYDIPTLHENKTYSAVVYQNDCTTLVANDTSLWVQANNASVNGVLVVSLNVNQSTVRESPYWSEINQTVALLSFCFRVDLYLYNQSINFHETNVSIAIDMTSGFDLSTWSPVNANEQSYTDSIADYPVIAYYCNDKNEVILAEDIILMDGGTLQFCVEIDPTLDGALYVRGLQRVSLDQKRSAGAGSNHADIVSDSAPDPTTTVRCASGICNVFHLLSSQWFTEGDLNDVVTTGVALLSFGSPSVFTDDTGPTFTSRRHLSLDPDLVPLYGYDGPNLTVVNRTSDESPNGTAGGIKGTFSFRTPVAPPAAVSYGPTAFQQGVKIAAYVAAGVAGAAIAALVAAKALASSALATSGLSGAADGVSPNDAECDDEEGTEAHEDGDDEEYRIDEGEGDEEGEQDEENVNADRDVNGDEDAADDENVEDDDNVQVDEDLQGIEDVDSDLGVNNEEVGQDVVEDIPADEKV